MQCVCVLNKGFERAIKLLKNGIEIQFFFILTRSFFVTRLFLPVFPFLRDTVEKITKKPRFSPGHSNRNCCLGANGNLVSKFRFPYFSIKNHAVNPIKACSIYGIIKLQKHYTGKPIPWYTLISCLGHSEKCR